MAIQQPNQLHRKLLGISGMNFGPGYVSSSRLQMMCTHLGQALVLKHSTERRIQTGIERKLSQYTFSVKMPTDGTIIRMIPRYQQGIGQDAIAQNPSTMVIYEDDETKEIGILELKEFCSYHQHFGFNYKPSQACKGLHRGASVRKDTVLLDSPSVTESGGYKMGREFNVAYMSHPAVSEDGIVISRDVLPYLTITTFEKRVVEFGSEYYPLNIYGDENNFKSFPDIGDWIHPTGLLMALRKYDETMAPVEMNIYDLMEVDYDFDKTIYGPGPGGRIIDIKVHHDSQNYNPPTPMGMELQAAKYDRERREYYNSILSEYNRLKRERGDGLQITKEFHNLVVEAISVVGETEQRIIKHNGKNPLDDWRIEFVIAYDHVPTDGFKLTDFHGGKGVICKIMEPEDMPVDKDGNRADIIMDGLATVNRMNPARRFEQYINAASRDVVKRLKVMTNNLPIEAVAQATIDEGFDMLMQYYSICSTRMLNFFQSGKYKGTKAQHVAHVLKHGIYLYIPPENEIGLADIVRQLEIYFPQTYGPVTYVGNSGKRVTTKENIRIGSVYFMMLEKIADDGTAVASAPFQHFGVLAPTPKSLRYARPSRMSPIRESGESEIRLKTSYCGPAVVAELLDRNNSIATHEAILDTLLRAPYPTNVECAVDRKQVPLGNSRPVEIVRNIGASAGWEMKYNPMVL